jgi:prolyl-tRNA editing enzyme YbaK/EbsC (Cys-tRNA(Pro) deacylase)
VTDKLLAREPVRRVQTALAAGGSGAQVIALADTARTAADAAASLGVPVGAIVKSLVFAVDGKAVLALVAGDRQCAVEQLPNVLGLAGKPGRADADLVKQATGFSIGGVAPVGHATKLPVAIDASLGRFTQIYAAAGHPHCVFATTLAELSGLTGGYVSDALTN